MMFAELTGLEIGGCIVAIVVGVSGLAIGIIGLLKKTEVQVEQPVSVKVIAEMHEEFASRTAFEAHMQKTDDEFAALRDEHRRDRELSEQSARTRITGVYSRVDATRMELSTKMDDNRRELSSEINSMEARIIATLKNTGAIGRHQS